MTSAFIIDVQSQLQPDPNNETAALLRVLIHKIDNTTFGNDVPTLPQWTGPPHTIVHVQAMLYASLAASLFSAFLAMLGKQWLNRYASTDVRGTAIERSQNRQRKLDGVVTWYFDSVMESLPLTLQIALLLLGCALSRYLWEINITVASVVLGVTLFGMILYLFVVVAGAASEGCPYQTPGARIFRHIFLSTLRSVPRFIKASHCYRLPIDWWSSLVQPWHSMDATDTLLCTLGMLIAPATDTLFLGRAALRSFVAFGRMACRRFMDSSPQAHVLELRCISWMLRTSLDQAVHLSTLKHLEPLMSTSADLDPALVTYCFDVFVGCTNVNHSQLVVIQGLEQLATVSAQCLFHIIFHLLVMDPTSSALRDMYRRYGVAFPDSNILFHHQFPHTMNAACWVLIGSVEMPDNLWDRYEPPHDEHIIIAHTLVKLAQLRYQRVQPTKVPRWILRFSLYSLSMVPPLPTSVIADCLSIIAIDLGCDVSDAGAEASDER